VKYHLIYKLVQSIKAENKGLKALVRNDQLRTHNYKRTKLEN